MFNNTRSKSETRGVVVDVEAKEDYPTVRKYVTMGQFVVPSTESGC